MSSDNVAIRVSNLSKMFKIYSKPSDMLWEVISRKTRHTEFWALRNVSFEVKRGEVVGVIGRNGAGKTTMLRIIAETLDKTSGDVEVYGKVSAIMALGTGFNPELSGRENIIMGGLCLGLSKHEITKKMDGIINFSGLEAFINQPVKTYSSGMQAKLAFSTAASVEADILIIDEALSTGDMAFAAKSYARIRKIARSGATVFFVTHALPVIYDLCNTAILLEQGRITDIGEPRQIGYAYEKIMHQEMAMANNKERTVYSIHKSKKRESEYESGPIVNEPDETMHDSDRFQDRSQQDEAANEESHGLKLDMESLNETAIPLSSTTGGLTEQQSSPGAVLDISVLNADGHKVRMLDQQQHYTIRVRAVCNQTLRSISIGFRLQNPSGTTIYGTSTSIQGIDVSAQAGDIVSVHFTFDCFLACGIYFLSSGVAENLGDISEYYLYRMIQYHAGAETIEVVGPLRFSGYVDLKSKVKAVEHEPV